MRRVRQFFACQRTLERLLGARAMLCFMSEGADIEVLDALELPPFERMQRLLSKLAFFPDNPDFISEIVIAQVELGRSPSDFLLTHAYELLVRDGRVLGAIILLGRVMKSGVPVPGMHDCLVALHKIAQQIDVGVAPDGLMTREYVVESAPAPDELKIWVEMMGEEELLLQADDLVEALSFDREAFIPLPVPFFSELSFEHFVNLLDAVDYTRVAKGESVLNAGAEEDFLVIPVSGHLNIRVNETHMAKVGPGVVLGEGAMLYGTPRNASAVAHEDGAIIKLHRAQFEELCAIDSRFRAQLEEFYQKRVRGNALDGSPVFELLDDYRQYTVIDDFKLLGIPKDAELASELVDWERGLLVVTGGQLVILNGDEGAESFRFGVNDALGGTVLPPSARVMASRSSTLIHVGPEIYEELYRDHPRFRSYIERLRKLIEHALGSAGPANL